MEYFVRNKEELAEEHTKKDPYDVPRAFIAGFEAAQAQMLQPLKELLTALKYDDFYKSHCPCGICAQIRTIEGLK